MEYSQKKNRNVIFFKKFRQNQRSFFSRKFLQEISNFSKITQYFQFIVFGPLRRVFKTSFGKFLEKKSEYFFFKKFRTTFFFCEKIGFLGLFSKMPPLGRRFDPGWPQDFSPPPLSKIHSLPSLDRWFDPGWPQIFSSPTTKNVPLPTLGRWFDPRWQQHFFSSPEKMG